MRLLQDGPLPRAASAARALAESLRYEEAARLRDRIEALEHLIDRLRRLERLRSLEVCLIAPALGARLAEGVLRLRRRSLCRSRVPPGSGAALEINAGLSLCRQARDACRDTLTARAGGGPPAPRRLHPSSAARAGSAAARRR